MSIKNLFPVPDPNVLKTQKDISKDWENDACYKDLTNDKEAFAWHFLRRNPLYIKDFYEAKDSVTAGMYYCWINGTNPEKDGYKIEKSRATKENEIGMQPFIFLKKKWRIEYKYERDLNPLSAELRSLSMGSDDPQVYAFLEDPVNPTVLTTKVNLSFPDHILVKQFKDLLSKCRENPIHYANFDTSLLAGAIPGLDSVIMTSKVTKSISKLEYQDAEAILKKGDLEPESLKAKFNKAPKFESDMLIESLRIYDAKVSELPSKLPTAYTSIPRVPVGKNGYTLYTVRKIPHYDVNQIDTIVSEKVARALKFINDRNRYYLL